MQTKYLSVRQVWDRLNRAISQKQIYNYVRSGRLHSTRAFGKVLILESSLDALLAEGEKKTGGVVDTPPVNPPTPAVSAAPENGRSGPKVRPGRSDRKPSGSSPPKSRKLGTPPRRQVQPQASRK